eukprot:481564_1
MKDLYLKSRKLRLPLLRKWLVQYLIAIKVTPATWRTAKFDDLTKALLLLMMFFSISRPCELLFTDKTEDPELDIIRTGLRWGDVKFENQHLKYTQQYMTLKIEWFKNQQFRGEPKLIHMAPPTCGDKTHECAFLDFYGMYKVYQQRRVKLYAQARTHFESHRRCWSKAKQQKQRQYLFNLRVTSDAFVFVYSNGKVLTPSDLSKVMKQLAATIKLKNPKAYPSYALRIGATSLAVC